MSSESERLWVVISSAERELPSAWITLPLCVALSLVGIFLVMNIGGIPKRLHERISGSPKGFLDSYDFQRLLGVFLLLVGAWGTVGSVLRLMG